MRGRAKAAALLLLALAGGCAYGGGGRTGGPDAGTSGRDTGVPGVDSGRTGVDSGVPGVDSGRPGVDAGRDSGSTACAESPCRLVAPQCGCGAGEGCYVNGSGARSCATAGTEGEGQTCSGETACRAGHLCVGIAGTAFCSRFCNTDTDCTGGPGSLCLLTLNDGSGGALPGVTLCTIACNPAAATGCPSGMACAIYQESAGAMRTFTGCRAAGTGTAGSPCTTEDDCQPGYFCADAGLGNECIRWCTYPSGVECGGRTCNPFADGGLYVGATQYGYCY